jgi:hypothetical protein
MFAELLSAKDEQMVSAEYCDNLLSQRFRYRLAEVDRADFGAEAAVECNGYSFRPPLRRSRFENIQWHGLVVRTGFHVFRSAVSSGIPAGDRGDIVDKYTL